MKKTWIWPPPAETFSPFDLEYNIYVNISCVIDSNPLNRLYYTTGMAQFRAELNFL